MRLPDLRACIAIATAAAVIIQQALPGTRWSVIATVIIGALSVHATGPGDPPSSSTSTRAPSSPAAAAPTSTSTRAPSSPAVAVTAAQPALVRPYAPGTGPAIPPSKTIPSRP